MKRRGGLDVTGGRGEREIAIQRNVGAAVLIEVAVDSGPRVLRDQLVGGNKAGIALAGDGRGV